MLLGLLLGRLRQPPPRAARPYRSTAHPRPDLVRATLRAIADRIAENGQNALTTGEKLVWNSAVVIAMMSGDSRIGVPPDATISCWGAASAGFRAMELPALAEFVRLLVLELAYRADLDAADRAADSASLLRIAELKRTFRAVEAEVDFRHELQALIVRLREARPRTAG